jgi:hypothetical protein
MCEISGSHGSEYEDQSLLDVAPCSLLRVDQRFRGAYCLKHFIALMEAVRTSETSVYSNETTRRYIPEGSSLQLSM